TAYVAAWSVGIIVACVLAFPGLALGDIIGLLGLSSVAIGFAFQDIFKNFLAGILLLLQEPFKLGDQIVVEGYEGTVEEIAIRSTQIRTYQGERVVIPNAVVFTNVVQVKTAFSHRRTDLEIGVDYNTPLPQAVDTLLKAVSQVPGVLSKPEPEVDIVGFGESSIDMMVRYWTEPERPSVRRTQTKVAIALKEACDRANINIPYPVRTLYYYDQEKFAEHSPVSGNGDRT
ncbi:MAG TPA: mechanosensitive ion channel family protein, partial [Vampirovibrionales bacterium]